MPTELARHWSLDPATTFLNHGSFGATPRAVLAAQSAWRERMEREPVAFFARDLEPALDEARAALGAFIGADPEALAFVPNATAGVNTVARSLELTAGDEVLALDHEYPAVRNALDAAVTAAGGRLVIAPLAFPGTTPELARDAVLDAVTARTRLVVVDHVTSATALVLPIAEIVAELADRGIDTLVDGAHAPGMLALDVDAIGAAYYTGNCHKWLCAPKGSAFLHVRADRRDRVRPLSISHGATSPRTDRTRFRLEHDWTGTLDPTAWLTVPDAIRFGATLMPGGWPALIARNRELAIGARDRLCAALGVAPPAPDAMLGSMTSIPLPTAPGSLPAAGRSIYDDPLHAALQRHGIQVALSPWPLDPAAPDVRRLLRVSAAAYVSLEDVERLAAVLPDLVPAPSPA
jgi:isopenicillin-N epimerase